jgi:two-component sensor histidine kinase
MNSSTLEAHAHDLRARIESLSNEHESLSTGQSKLKSGAFREQLRLMFLQTRILTHQIVDRLPVGQWFILLCLPAAMAAVCLVFVDIVLGVRWLSTVSGVSAWILSVVGLAALLKGRGDVQLQAKLQQCQRSCSQMQLQAEEMSNRRTLLKQQIAEYESELANTMQQLQTVLESNSLERIRRDLYRQNWKAMRDVEFEQFLEKVCLALGYLVETTATTGDQGVDLIVAKDGIRVAVQVKGYHSSVGNGAIQEAFAGMAHYQCHACAVITNSRFTSSAVTLAKSTNCRLIDEESFRDFVMGRIELVPSLTY